MRYSSLKINYFKMKIMSILRVFKEYLETILVLDLRKNLY